MVEFQIFTVRLDIFALGVIAWALICNYRDSKRFDNPGTDTPKQADTAPGG